MYHPIIISLIKCCVSTTILAPAFSAWHVRAQLKALATEVAAAMARLVIATSAAAKEDRRRPDGNGGAGASWRMPWEQLGDWRAVWDGTCRQNEDCTVQTVRLFSHRSGRPMCRSVKCFSLLYSGIFYFLFRSIDLSARSVCMCAYPCFCVSMFTRVLFWSKLLVSFTFLLSVLLTFRS